MKKFSKELKEYAIVIINYATMEKRKKKIIHVKKNLVKITKNASKSKTTVIMTGNIEVLQIVSIN